MKQSKRRQRIGRLFMVLSAAVLFAGGCNCSREVTSLRKQNQILTQRVAELEYQLQQADVQAIGGQSVYIVVEGDNLWGIAQKQLGNGSRYKEILALNRHITKDQPLAIGTKLILPVP